MNDQTTEATARTLLASGYGPLEFDGIHRAVVAAGIVAPNNAIRFACTLIDFMLSIFDAEVAPFILSRPSDDPCYSTCSPKGRCARDFGYGVTVEHSFTGNRWIAEGREHPDRRAAERAARRSVLLLRLRSELQRKPEFSRRERVGA